MKFVTFINLAYTELCFNLYLQLREFNRHTDLIVVCTDIVTYKKICEYNLNCQIKIYKPVVFIDHINTIQSHLENTEYVSTHNQSQSYTMYQFLKHDAFYQALVEHDHVCLIDSDMIIFEDFVDELMFWVNNTRKFRVFETPSCLAFKYYLQIKISINTFDTLNLYKWIGREQIINGGLIYANKCENVLNHIRTYCKLFVPHFGQLNNIDEVVVTEYFKNHNENTFAITDHINLINNVGVNYTPDQVLKFRPMTFHPTFEPNKVEFLKECGKWLVK